MILFIITVSDEALKRIIHLRGDRYLTAEGLLVDFDISLGECMHLIFVEAILKWQRIG
jgi:hypothetical protein